MECLRLRIQDVDFGQNPIYVQAGKGDKNRTTFLPQIVKDELRWYIEKVKDLQRQDLEADVKTTEIHTHIMRNDLCSLQSPIDRMYAKEC